MAADSNQISAPHSSMRSMHFQIFVTAVFHSGYTAQNALASSMAVAIHIPTLLAVGVVVRD